MQAVMKMRLVSHSVSNIMADIGGRSCSDGEELRINVDASVVEKLNIVGKNSWGVVFGRIFDSHIDVISALNLSSTDISETLKKPNGPDVGSTDALVNEIFTIIPKGIDVIGIYYHDNYCKDKIIQFASDTLVPRLIDEVSDFENSAEKFLICKPQEGQDSLEIDFLESYLTGDEGTSPELCIQYSFSVADDFFSLMHCMRIRCTMPCQCSTTDMDGSVWQEYTRISSKLKESHLAFIPKSFDSLFFPEDLAQTPIENVLNSKTMSDQNGVIDLEVILSMSSRKDAGEDVYGPILIFNSTADEIIKFMLCLDVVLYVGKSSTGIEFLHNVREALQIQAKNLLLPMAESRNDFGICKLGAFHFKPCGMKHLVTAIYPICTLDGLEILDKELIVKRRCMHNSFLLPMDRPLFRKSQEYFLDLASSHLINPHLGLKSGIVDGTCVLVHGKYAYHHYMQDRFDDNGWGCAYRSLQTICSWFKLQGYTTVTIPTHRQVQEALVKVGDKSVNFIGSKQWIGSFEVSMCLKEILQVDSKILHVSSGAELALKARELIEHFRSQGTPVMIGGGVLAHTILGIHFNESTGDIRFLILDPHYTGGEDLKTVQGKGWCGWKGPAFWDQTAHYNMCLPQRPIVI